MGSFSDFVLHKNGIPLIFENNQLENLKEQLFDACEKRYVESIHLTVSSLLICYNFQTLKEMTQFSEHHPIIV